MAQKPDHHPRTAFTTANKHQERIILLMLIPSVLMFTAFVVIIFIANPIVMDNIYQLSIGDLNGLVFRFSQAIIISLCLILFISIIATFVISHRIVGAFGRIIRELDEIIAGRSKKTILGRKDDELANDLLKRVNILVQIYLDKKD